MIQTLPHGEIRVACKDTYPYTWWRVSQLGKLARPLKLKKVELFRNDDFPGYEPRTVEMDKSFPSAKVIGTTSMMLSPTQSSHSLTFPVEDV